MSASDILFRKFVPRCDVCGKKHAPPCVPAIEVHGPPAEQIAQRISDQMLADFQDAHHRIDLLESTLRRAQVILVNHLCMCGRFSLDPADHLEDCAVLPALEVSP